MNAVEITIIILLVLILFLMFCYFQNNKIDITKYHIKSKSTDKSFKIAHLSDLHSKPFKKILPKLLSEKPDIICITGDYINDKCKNKEKMLVLGKMLTEIAPVYYITGNHERRINCFDEIMSELSKIGFNVLLNDITENEYCTILGLDENQADFKDYKARRNGTFVYKDMSRYFEMLENLNGFRLVLCHFPENFEGISELNYSQYDFDLQLSGHAHGGQWIMPFIGPLFSPGQGILPKYARGTFGDKPRLIISRGLGNSEFPLRLFNHPEIVIINVNKN
ncbi:MAG: metallophosphoesterase [Acetobacter sp.]|nr:metallophosphoesterase [Bacteroides sp.]MCM1340500.1 metallophosphoesterase [Acetobacter sp.]MCM1433240.1 metallophosphoesterase [Clostridiales bacterium]